MPRSLRFQLAVGGLLLGVLGTLGWVLDFGVDRRVVVDGEMPLAPDDAGLGLEAEGARRIRYSPTFVLERPATLEVTLERGPERGWLDMDVGVVNEETARVREFTMGIAPDDRSASARLDQVGPGPHALRLDPRWKPQEGGRSVTVRVRAMAGGRSPWPFALAAALIAAPPLWSLGTWLRHRNGRATEDVSA